MSVLIRPWAPSRAVAMSWASRASTPREDDSAGVDVVMGFASLASRRPKSKVYGVGRSTMTSSFVFAVFPAAAAAEGDMVMVIDRGGGVTIVGFFSNCGRWRNPPGRKYE